jgi:GMP synthase-like glutamine amidotransferase
MTIARRSLYVLQHTDSEYLGQVEDHLEGRSIGFTYMRPHASGGRLPATVRFTDGMFLLGGGPWGSLGARALPSLSEEVDLVRQCLDRGAPVVGFGLGAQILALAGGGSVEGAPLTFEVSEARRVDDRALNGFLPDRYPLVVYMRDRPLPPPHARVLAEDGAGRPALFQVADNSLGFTGHPGIKPAMIEDLIMEFAEGPEDPGPGLEKLRGLQGEIEDALVLIMTGMMQITGWMEAR